MATFRLGALDPRHRRRLAEILTATAVFSPDEIDVALELFDETFGVSEEREGEGEREPSPLPLLTPHSSYEFLGLFAADNMLVGYACYGPTSGTEGTFDLYWIAVHPTAQGTGEGGRMLAEVERLIRRRGGRLIVVETSSRAAYASTRRFYDARGYDEAARVADFYAPSDDRLIYTKRLVTADAAPAPRSHSTHGFARSASP